MLRVRDKTRNPPGELALRAALAKLDWPGLADVLPEAKIVWMYRDQVIPDDVLMRVAEEIKAETPDVVNLGRIAQAALEVADLLLIRDSSEPNQHNMWSRGLDVRSARGEILRI